MRTVVLPNHDTTYTVGRLQLADGARVLDVPNTAGRYYVIQLLDAYSNTFAYVGRRTTGTRAGSYAIVPPGFKGSLPAGVKRIQSPTNLVWVLGRTLVSDQADMPAVADPDGRLHGSRRSTPGWAGHAPNPLVLGGFPTVAPVRHPQGAGLLREARRDPDDRPCAEARRLRAEGLRARRHRPRQGADRRAGC